MDSLTKVLSRAWVRRVLWILFAAFLIILPLTQSRSINYQLSLVAVFAVAILGLNILMGYTGQVSLGQSAFLGLGAYIAAIGVINEWPVVLTFLLCAAVPALVGLVISLAAARLRGLALAMVTIALPIVGVPLAKRFSDVTGGAQGLTVSWMRTPEWAEGFLANDQWRYYVVVVIAVLAVLAARNLVQGRIGRAFRVVKENESVAIAMGVSPYRYKVLAFTIASLLGGVAGFLYLAVVQFTSPETMSFHTSVNLLAAMVIGGSGSILGTLLGATYFVLVPNLANQLNPSLTALVSGAILLAVLFVLPGGLVSLPRRFRQLRRSPMNSRATPGDHQTPPLSTPGATPAVESEITKKDQEAQDREVVRR